MVISRPGSTASRRSSSAPPNTQVTWLAGSGCQRPLRDTPPNTASIRCGARPGPGRRGRRDRGGVGLRKVQVVEHEARVLGLLFGA